MLDEDQLIPSHPFNLSLSIGAISLLRSSSNQSAPGSTGGAITTAPSPNTPPDHDEMPPTPHPLPDAVQVPAHGSTPAPPPPGGGAWSEAPADALPAAASAAASPAASAAASAASAESRPELLLQKCVTVDKVEVCVCRRESALPREFLAVANLGEVFENVLAPALSIGPPLLEVKESFVRCTLHRGDSLKHGAELGLFWIDAPRLALNLDESQLTVLAKLLEWGFNYSRFQPNLRDRPARRVRGRGSGWEHRETLRAWWRWALRGVRRELRRHQSRKLELSWSALRERREIRERYKYLFRRVHGRSSSTASSSTASTASTASSTLAADAESLIQLELSLSVVDILYFRSLARALMVASDAAAHPAAADASAAEASASSAMRGITRANRPVLELLGGMLRQNTNTWFPCMCRKKNPIFPYISTPTFLFDTSRLLLSPPSPPTPTLLLA